MGLNRTLYTVSEDVGVVEVCAEVTSPVLSCPIEFSFTVLLSTNNGTACKYIKYNIIHCCWSYSL